MRRPAIALTHFPTSLDRAAPAVVALGVAAVAGLAGLAIAVAGVPALILCVGVVACLFVLLDFRAGVVMLIVLMPIASSQFFPRAMLGVTGLNPFNLLLAATLVSFVVRELARGGMRGFVPRPLLWLYLVPLVIAGFLGSRHVDEIAGGLRELGAVSFDSAGSYLRDMLMRPFFMVLFALLLGAAVARSQKPEKLLVPALLSVWIMCALVIFFVAKEGVSLGELSSDRFRQFFLPLGMHANDLGRLYMVAYALLLFTWGATEHKAWKFILLASMLVTTLALVLTMSRGAFLGFALVNVMFLFTRRTAGAFLFALVVVTGLLFVMPDSVWDRLGTAFSGDFNTSSAGRTDEIWTPLLPEVWRSPIWGNGLGSIMWSDAMRGGQILLVTHPHNAYLQAALDVGLLGMAILLAYFVHVWRSLTRLVRDEAVSPTMHGFFNGARAGLAGFFLAGVAGSSLAPVPEQAFLWLAIGMMYGYLRPRSNDEEQPA
jgi:O-antigen ligase